MTLSATAVMSDRSIRMGSRRSYLGEGEGEIIRASKSNGNDDVNYMVWMGHSILAEGHQTCYPTTQFGI